MENLIFFALVTVVELINEIFFIAQAMKAILNAMTRAKESRPREHIEQEPRDSKTGELTLLLANYEETQVHKNGDMKIDHIYEP